jgi:outer membrane cobalamin receptor
VAAATLRGTVIDFKTHEPLGRVKVTVAGSDREALTDAQGRFELTPLPPGAVALTLATVGYGVSRQTVQLAANQVLVLTVPLGAEALKPGAPDAGQVVTVTGRATPRAALAQASVFDIGNTDLQNLSTVLANDPLRAVHNLPGVTANQDFYGQFAVRGAPSSKVGVQIDGVLLDNAFHGFTDQGDLGSVSIANGTLVDSTTLFSGVAPARFGGRLGGAVEIETREGSRDERFTRIDLDSLSASATTEGPIGADRRGSYLISARKSFLQYLMSNLKVGSGTLGYSDLDLKLDYALTATDKLSLTTVLGSSEVTRQAQTGMAQSQAFLTQGSGTQAFSTLRWTSVLSPNTTSRAQLFWTLDDQTQKNEDGALLQSRAARQAGVSEVLTHRLSDQHTLEGGLSLVRRSTALQENALWNYQTGSLSSSLVPAADFSRSAMETSAHLQDSFSAADERFKLKAGARVDHSSATGQTVFLPRLDALATLQPGTQVSAALGQTAQFPSMDQLYGKFGTPSLKAERATKAALALEQSLGDRWGLRAEVYERRESGVIDSPATHFRLTDDESYAVPQAGAVLTNGLKGDTHGVELMLQRRSANGYSGWVSVSRSFNRYTPADGGPSFWGDQDQRTAVTAYGSVRWSDSLSFSATARYGSGTPVPGYLGAASTSASPQGETRLAYDLASGRNTQRMGAYQRLDLRVNKVIYGADYKLTLKAEIANVLGHDNWRYFDYTYPAPGAPQTVQITRNTTMPRLPTVGMSLEF